MRILDILNAPWAIPPAKLQEIRDIYLSHVRGEKIDLAAIEAKIGKPLNNDQPPYSVVDGVAVIPIDGVIAKKMNLFSRISGGVSTQLIQRDFQQALEDPAVTSIVLLIDSPGGTVDGTQDLAQTIYAARGTKPIAALADGLMASAAYWIGSAADKVYLMNDTVEAGSIGVVATHVDVSGAEAQRGVKTTEITAGKFKRIDTAYAPLSKEGREYIQDQVDYIYSVFVHDIATFRGTSVDKVLQQMADGRIFIGQQAIDAGLADGMMSLEELVQNLSAQQNQDRLPAGTPVPAGVFSDPAKNSEGADTSMEITKALIEKDYPQLAEEFRSEGYAKGKTEGATEGATAERERIKSVEAQALPGHEALIAELKFDGKTTGPEAAVQVLNAEKTKLGKRLETMRNEAPKPVSPSPAADPTPAAAKEDAELPIEERAKKVWDSDAKIRNEFTSFDSYLAYVKAEANGQVKLLGKK